MYRSLIRPESKRELVESDCWMRWPERVTLLTSENEEVGEDEEMSLMQVGGREEGLEDGIRRATSDDEEVSGDEDMRMRREKRRGV